MEGDAERPGTKAENWSRRDGIRAGAVSGPWRSAPRAGTPVSPPRAIEPDGVEAPAVRRTAPPRSALPWVAGGVGFVVLCVAALLMRPAPEAERPETVPAEAIAAPVAGEADAAALANVSEVRLRVSDSLDPMRREALAAALSAGGVGAVQEEVLPFAIETSRVGYYREEDRATADAIAALVGPLVTPGAALPVRDYGKLLDDPQPGRIDLWVSE